MAEEQIVIDTVKGAKPTTFVNGQRYLFIYFLTVSYLKKVQLEFFKKRLNLNFKKIYQECYWVRNFVIKVDMKV